MFSKLGSHFIISCLAIWLLTHHAWAQKTVEIQPKLTSYVLSSELELLEDPHKVWDLEDVRNASIARQFQPTAFNAPNYGYTNSAYWARIEVHFPEGVRAFEEQSQTESFKTYQQLLNTHSQNQWILDFGAPNIDQLDFYLIRDSGSIEHYNMGRLQHFSSRPYPHRNFIIPFIFTPGERLQIYIRAETTDLLRFPLSLWTYQAFSEYDAQQNYILGGYYGLILSMILYNLCLFIGLRNRHYLFYVMFVGSFLMFQWIEEGGAFEHFWPAYPLWNQFSQVLFAGLSIIGATLMVTNLLQLKKFLPHWVGSSRIFLLLTLTYALTVPLFSHRLGMIGMGIFGLFCIAILFILSQIAKRHNVRLRSFFIAASVLIIAGVIYILASFGFPLSIFALYGIKMGVALMAILFSFLLADHIQVLEQQAFQHLEEKEAFQAKVIEQLRHVDQLKDEFLANTSHELRTPLHGIIGLSESLLEGNLGLLPTKAREYVNMIASCGKQLISLVNDILDFSQLKRGDINLQKRAVDVRLMANDIITFFNNSTQGKDLSIENQLPSNLPPVHVDENRLQQILYNLIGNAVKFTESGRVWVEAKWETQEPDPPLGSQPAMLEIIVSDTGPGISEEQQGNIFQAFEQGMSTLHKSYEGTGLGLTITRHLVELHSGTIWVDSKVGQGASFHFTLPISSLPASLTQSSFTPPERLIKPIPENLEPAEPQNTTGKDAVILVVDDDETNLRLVVDHLEKANYKAIAFNSGNSALQWLEENTTPALILLDIMMPELSGWEVCQMIREAYPSHILPIIFLTAKTQSSDLEYSLSVGGNDYLMKPFSKQELLLRIHNQLSLSSRAEGETKRLEALRLFSESIAGVENESQIMEQAFELLWQQLAPSSASLTRDHLTLLEHHIQDMPPEEQWEIPSDTSIEIFYWPSSQDSPKGIGFRLRELPDDIIRLWRSEEARPFTQADIEYIQHVMQHIRKVRTALRRVSVNPQLLPALAEIELRLDELLYVQSETVYCRFFFENDPEEVELRILLKNLQSYFPEELLLRIHKSYLINPQKVLKSWKRKNRYEIFLSQGEPIPIGRIYLSKLQKKYPRWFSK